MMVSTFDRCPPALRNLWLLLVLFCGCRGYRGRRKVPSVIYNILETRPPPQIKVSIFKNTSCGYPYEKKKKKFFSRKQPNNNNNNTGNSIPPKRPLSVPGIPLSSRPTPIPDAGRSVFTLPPPRRHNSSLGSSPSESVEEILETTVMTPFSA